MNSVVENSVIEITNEHEKTLNFWILFLFYSNGYQVINGRLRVLHMLFMISETLNVKFRTAANFYPYQFGPYSSRIAQQINNLLDLELIKAAQKNGYWQYAITIKGARQVESSYNNHAIYSFLTIKRLQQIKTKYYNMSTKNILHEIRTNYSNYIIGYQGEIIKNE